MYFLIMLLYISIPLAVIAFFIVSLCMFLSARSKEKCAPGSVSKGKLITSKILLIVSSVLAGEIVTVVLLVLYLMLNPISFM